MKQQIWFTSDHHSSACGAQLDRDVNSSNVILKFGLGCSLVNLESSGGAL